MDGAEENRENVDDFRGVSGISRNSMHKLMKRSHFSNVNEEKEWEEDEEIELSLGLSMNGRFGVDPTRKKLRRSSSVSNVVVNVDSVGNGSSPQARGVAFGSYAQLVRACSMPSETQEWCRRKEFQSVASTEARKNRMEKLKNVRVVKEKENCSEDAGGDGNGNGLHENANGSFSVQRRDSGSLKGLIESKRGSSGISDLQNQFVKGATQNSTTKSSSSHQFPQEPVVERPAVRAADTNATDKESMKNALVDMPYVSTRGYGPNHNKIEGFLYRYKKGEEVKIVCVCHGMFLSPAEFVKHGGGGDVACPLKHIVVNPFPLY